jgi:hypothetical protein
MSGFSADGGSQDVIITGTANLLDFWYMPRSSSNDLLSAGSDIKQEAASMTSPALHCYLGTSQTHCRQHNC